MVYLSEDAKTDAEFSYKNKLGKLYSEATGKLYKEAGNKMNVDSFIRQYKGVYRVGDCKKASEKVEERLEGFRSKRLDISINDSMYDYVQTHYYASDGNKVVDLTAPYYIKEFIQEGIASAWHKANQDKVLFDERDYLKNFKELKKKTTR